MRKRLFLDASIAVQWHGSGVGTLTRYLAEDQGTAEQGKERLRLAEEGAQDAPQCRSSGAAGVQLRGTFSPLPPLWMVKMEKDRTCLRHLQLPSRP